MELLNDMALFVAVGHTLSFRKAADAAGVPNSTLSRRISALEKAIGLRLLHLDRPTFHVVTFPDGTITNFAVLNESQFRTAGIVLSSLKETAPSSSSTRSGTFPSRSSTPSLAP